MQTPPTPETKDAAAPTVDKSRFKFQKLLQPFTIERGIATFPIYFRRVDVAILGDAGTAFDTSFDASRDVRASLGGALRLDAFFGYYAAGTLEVGLARGLAHDGITETWFLLTGSL